MNNLIPHLLQLFIPLLFKTTNILIIPLYFVFLNLLGLLILLTYLINFLLVFLLFLLNNLLIQFFFFLFFLSLGIDDFHELLLIVLHHICSIKQYIRLFFYLNLTFLQLLVNLSPSVFFEYFQLFLINMLLFDQIILQLVILLLQLFDLCYIFLTFHIIFLLDMFYFLYQIIYFHFHLFLPVFLVSKFIQTFSDCFEYLDFLISRLSQHFIQIILDS